MIANKSIYWYETTIKPTGIHNHSSKYIFTHDQRSFLARGLRFIACSPTTHSYNNAATQLLQDTTRGWTRFNRTITNKLIYDDTAAASSSNPSHFLPKFHIPTTRTLPITTADNQLCESNPMGLQMLQQYRQRTETALTAAVTDPRTRSSILRQRANLTSQDRLFMQRLMSDPDITIKPADKNLGMVLVDTTWYDTEIKRMLKDRVTYSPIEQHCSTSKRDLTFATIQKKLLGQLPLLANRHASTLERWHPTHAEQMERFLKQRITATKFTVPSIYLLIKVHKPSGLCGRPIVPSHSWITAPASVLVDHLLQDIVKQKQIEWMVVDTKSFINHLERSPLPTQDGSFVTADIASLYTNIDTQLGLQLVKQFLTEDGIPQERIDLIMDLLSFVMLNSYLTYGDTIYHQIDGTAMGTSCAPIYANIVVYMLERQVINEMKVLRKKLHAYHRYLDDIYAYLDSDAVAEFQCRMNALHPKLKFDFATSSHDATFLDLHIHKGTRFKQTGVVDLRCHQKKMNLYLYLPWDSYHTDAMKRSFIQTELQRYIRNSSDRQDYLTLKAVFFQRLRDRGYRIRFLEQIFDSIHYADRPYFLSSSHTGAGTGTLATHPLIHSRPPLSECLLKKLRREIKHGQTVNTQSTPSTPTVFIIPYSPLSHRIPTRFLLCQHWGLLNAACGSGTGTIPRPIIAYQSMPSMMKLLVYIKARKIEQTRKQKQLQLAPPKLTQPSMETFFARAPSSANNGDSS